MRPLLAILFFVVLIAVPGLDAPAHAAAASSGAASDDGGSIGIRLIDMPASAQDDPRAHRYIVDHLPPGTTIERRIEVTNDTGATQDVELYPAAADIRDGLFLGRDGREGSDLTGWTSIADGTLELAPGESRQTLVTIAVPDDAVQAEHYGVIWAEVRTAPDPDTAVVTASRVGVRVYLSVGPGAEPASELEIGGITASRDPEGSPQVTATVTNTGGRALDLSGTLRLEDGPSSLTAGPFEAAGVTTLAPGESGDLVVPLGDDLPNGPWLAVLELRSGTLIREARATVTFPAAGETVALDVEEHGQTPAVLLVGGIGLASAVALAALALWCHRRRPSRR